MDGKDCLFDITKYDYCKEHGWRSWAWEFLRRNDKFQEDWDIFAEQYGTIGGEGEAIDCSNIKPFYDKWKITVIIPHPSRGLDKFTKLIFKFVRKPPFIQTAHAEYRNGEGINKIICQTDHSGIRCPTYVPPKCIIAFIDLSIKLRPQLDYVEKEIEKYLDFEKSLCDGGLLSKTIDREVSETVIKKGFDKDKLCKYIMVYDAKKNGLKEREIANILYEQKIYDSGIETVKSDFRQAKKLIENYIDIAYLGHMKDDAATRQ
jgi:hypothetical protein